MDRDELIHLANHWYPIGAAVLSSILNFISFMIGIQWDGTKILQIGLLALIGTFIISGLTAFMLYKMSVSGQVQEFSIITSQDEYQILSPERVIYYRIISFRVNKDLPFITMFPPEVDGKIENFRVYSKNNPQKEYSVSIQKVAGKKVLWINMGYPLKKGSVIKDLCVEARLVNSFMERQEGVKVMTDLEQEKCRIRILLPKEHPPSLREYEWFVSYGRNPRPLFNGKGQIYKDGEWFIIDKDFSQYLAGKHLNLECAVSWEWAVEEVA